MGIARLHLITPDAIDASVVARTDAALGAGARWVQVRTKQAATTDGLRASFAAAMLEGIRAARATCIIDDRADIALAVGADGVHVGADDLPVAVVRTILGPGAIVGATCRNADDARRAADAGASYVGVGPIFATATKDGLPDPIGLAGLAAVTAAVDLPVIAIAGITVERVADVLDAGAHGVAVVAGVYGAADVGAATRSFLDALGEAAPVMGSAAR